MFPMRNPSSRRPSTQFSQGTASTLSILEDMGPIIPKTDLLIVDHENPLGKGSFGVVFRGIAYKEDVAIKLLFEKPSGFSNSAGTLDALLEEVKMLAELRHNNVISFKGVCLDPACIVTEYCSKGSIYDVLERMRKQDFDPLVEASQSSKSHRRRRRMKLAKKLKIAVGIAKGMYFLHKRSRPVLHCDLKSPNVVLREDWTPVVTDFGMARYKPERLRVQLNPTWLAPEMARDEMPCRKSDVFSFAIIMSELLTGQYPWDGRNGYQIHYALLFNKARPDIPSRIVNTEATKEYVKLMKRCWSEQRQDRPDFDEIVNTLERIIQKLHPNRQPNMPLVPLAVLQDKMSPEHFSPAATPSLAFGDRPATTTEAPMPRTSMFLKLLTCGLCGGSPPPQEAPQPLEVLPSESAQAPPQHLGHRPSPFARIPGSAAPSSIAEEPIASTSQAGAATRSGATKTPGNNAYGELEEEEDDDKEEEEEEEEGDDELLGGCVDTLFTVPAVKELDGAPGIRSGTGTTVDASEQNIKFFAPEEARAKLNVSRAPTTLTRKGGEGGSDDSPMASLGVVGTRLPSRESLVAIHKYVLGTVANDPKKGPIWERVISSAEGWKLDEPVPVADVEWRGFLAVVFGNCGGSKAEVTSFRKSKHWDRLQEHLVEDLVPCAGPTVNRGINKVDKQPEVPTEASLKSLGFHEGQFEVVEGHQMPTEPSMESLGFEGDSLEVQERNMIGNFQHPVSQSQAGPAAPVIPLAHVNPQFPGGVGTSSSYPHPNVPNPYGHPYGYTVDQPYFYGSYGQDQHQAHHQQPFHYGGLAGASQGSSSEPSSSHPPPIYHPHGNDNPGDGVI